MRELLLGITAALDVRLLYAVLALYVVVSLTIPYWVPLIQKRWGQLGVYWVFSILTYYAYLAWLIFAASLSLLAYSCPPLGATWFSIVVLRLYAFHRLSRRVPPLPAAASVGGSNSVGGGVKPAEAAVRPTGLGRVLLVGNGPSIHEREMGTLIDGFDTVVRFNNCVTKGLEEHTGRKTSVWCHMMQWYHSRSVEALLSLEWIPNCYAWNHVVLAPLVFVPGYLLPTLPPENGFTWGVDTYWRAHRLLRLRPHQVPTTGFVMIVKLLESVNRVTLVGFDGYGSGRQLHYYTEQRTQLQVNAAGALLHDWSKEQQGIHRLIAQGRVVLL